VALALTAVRRPSEAISSPEPKSRPHVLETRPVELGRRRRLRPGGRRAAVHRLEQLAPLLLFERR
jgi:hypothetical protein